MASPLVAASSHLTLAVGNCQDWLAVSISGLTAKAATELVGVIAVNLLCRRFFKTILDGVNRKLSTRCKHVNHLGGVKNSIRLLARVIPEFSYAARFDVPWYYAPIDHDVLLRPFTLLQFSEWSQDIVQQYLSSQDKRRVGNGIIDGASGS